MRASTGKLSRRRAATTSRTGVPSRARGLTAAVALQYPEYVAVPAGRLESESVYVNERHSEIHERYVLLVHQDSDIQEMAQLRDRQLLLWDERGEKP